MMAYGSAPVQTIDNTESSGWMDWTRECWLVWREYTCLHQVVVARGMGLWPRQWLGVAWCGVWCYCSDSVTRLQTVHCRTAVTGEQLVGIGRR